MVELPENHTEVYAEFIKGNFVFQKFAKTFSLIAKDHAHEQFNKSLQAHGGAVGLYESPEALALFILTGPDCVRIVEEFETVYDPPPSSTAHHEEGHSLQVKFRKDVLSFVDVVVHMGNLFIAARPELVALDTQNVMEQVVVTSLSQIHAVGQALHAVSVAERLENVSVPISDTIKRNNMFTFANRHDPKRKGKKDNCKPNQNMTLITQLFLSLQSRPDADMMDFFRFENQREPLSLADQGSLRAGKNLTYSNASVRRLAVHLLLHKPRSWCWIWRQ